MGGEQGARRRSIWHRDEVSPAPEVLVWDKSMESPELVAYNEYLKALAAGGRKKTWRNPRGLPETQAELAQ